MATESRGDGFFIWYDFVTTDIDRTEPFYAAVFGWRSDPEPIAPNGFRQLWNGDQIFGGTLPMAPGAGMRSNWLGYVQVDDLDRTMQRAIDLNGRVALGAAEIPEIGRFAVLADPTGAVFTGYEPARRDPLPMPNYDGPAGSVAWNELVTADLPSALTFYSMLFGWEMAPVAPQVDEYLIAKQNGRPVAGIFGPATAPANSSWITYFRTNDMSRSLAGIGTHGGSIVHDAVDIPNVGKTAWAADPTEGIFALMEPVDNWPSRL